MCIRDRNGVQWFNDSIATSPTRVIAGLRAFDQKLIIIAGGSDKGISFAPLAPDCLLYTSYAVNGPREEPPPFVPVG